MANELLATILSGERQVEVFGTARLTSQYLIQSSKFVRSAEEKPTAPTYRSSVSRKTLPVSFAS
jgi:hypothetical protein